MRWAEVEPIEHLVTALGIVVGGVWTWMLFVRRRQVLPRAKVVHEVSHLRIADGVVLLTVRAQVANTGQVLIRVSQFFTRVLQVLPPELPVDARAALLRGEAKREDGRTDLAWRSLDKVEHRPSKPVHEIEPGETDEVVFDFVIPDSVRSVRIYSYLENVRKRRKGIGWPQTTIYHLDPALRGASNENRQADAAANSPDAGTRDREDQDSQHD